MKGRENIVQQILIPEGKQSAEEVTNTIIVRENKIPSKLLSFYNSRKN